MGKDGGPARDRTADRRYDARRHPRLIWFIVEGIARGSKAACSAPLIYALMLALGSFIAAGFVASPVDAQPVGSVLWTEGAIHSEILGETRRLRISLPQGYQAPEFADERYAVLIALDAQLTAPYAMAPAAAWGLATGDAPAMPRLIVVGVATDDPTRYHDMTPPGPLGKRRSSSQV
jgi:hypothetical protein